MKITDILIERKIQRTALMYHGTSSVFLPNIMKHGLLANPPKLTYGRETHVGSVGYDSFGGVYLANNYSTAIEGSRTAVYAHGGKPNVITVQYVLSSGTIDEDDITYILFPSFSRAAYSFMTTHGNKFFDYNTAIDEITSDILDDFTLAINRKHFKTYSNTVDAIKALIGVTFSLLLKLLDVSDDKQAVSGIIKQGLLNKIRHEPEFESAMIKVLNTVKPLNSPTVRLTRNIGFRGKTRILKIEEIGRLKRTLYPRQVE